MKFTGRNGTLRVLDGARVLHGTAPRDDATPDIVKWDGATTWTNITTAVTEDDASTADNFLTDNDDAVFIGSDVFFAMVKFLKGNGSDYAVASGALKGYYFDGTDFNTALTISDGTASGGDCFAADGYINFKIPSDWAIGANAFNANLDSDKYYIKLMTTTSPSTDPDADVLCPADGQYFDISFAAMDFNAPLARPKTDEILVLNRGTMDSKAHYIEGADGKIYEAVPVSFSLLLDDVYNRERAELALTCGNPNDSLGWTATGTTTKAQTKNDGTNYNPSFKDATKKTVNVMWLLDTERTGSITQGLALYETFFPPDEIQLAEAEDGVTLSANGGCFGLIERIHQIANRY